MKDRKEYSRPNIQNYSRNIDGGGSHKESWSSLVTTGEQNYTVQGIAVEDLDEGKISEVPVQTGSRSFPGLLDRMTWEFEGYPARGTNTLPDSIREDEVMPVAGTEIGASLGYADDRLSRLEFLDSETKVEISL